GSELAADVRAAAVGEQQVENHRLRRSHRRLRQRVGGRFSRLDRIARGAQLELQGAQNLRLIVDDQDPGALHEAAWTGSSAAGSASAKVAPFPTSDSTQMRPPFSCTKPRAIARE